MPISVQTRCAGFVGACGWSPHQGPGAGSSGKSPRQECGVKSAGKPGMCARLPKEGMKSAGTELRAT